MAVVRMALDNAGVRVGEVTWLAVRLEGVDERFVAAYERQNEPAVPDLDGAVSHAWGEPRQLPPPRGDGAGRVRGQRENEQGVQ